MKRIDRVELMYAAGATENDQAQAESALLARVRRGDRGAFTALYRRYQPRLFAYLRRLLSDGQTVEEVLDDVMLVVWKDASKFRGDAAISTWIFGIAYRKALSAIRRHQAPIDRRADPDAESAREPAAEEWLSTALDKLSADHRQVVELTYCCGFSYHEIAEIAGCPVNTVKTRMFHARRRLKALWPALSGESRRKTRERA